MRFLADESRDFAVVRALKSAGFDVTAVRDAMPGAEDVEVIEMAVRESRVLLTEDKDFGQLVFASSAQSSGVVLIRYPANARKAMARSIVELASNEEHKLEGRFAVVQPGRVHVSLKL